MLSLLKNLLDTQVQFFSSPFGLFVFIIFYAAWVTLLLPGSWLSMFAGLVYGKFLGSLLVFLGAFSGAILTFSLCRIFLSKLALSKIESSSRLKFIQNVSSKQGLLFILMTRLSPLFPFGLLNLAYGVSNISFRRFMLGLIGILPGTILYCSLGALAGDITRFSSILESKDDLFSFSYSLLGILSTLGVVLFLGRAAKNTFPELDSPS